MSVTSPTPPTKPMNQVLTFDPPPNIFAMVMATGIVSLAVDGAGIKLISVAMLWLNLCLYGILWVLFVMRCLRHHSHVIGDLGNHARAPGFFTMVAATAVFGSQLVNIGGIILAGQMLWFVALFIWFTLTYKVLPELMEVEIKPPLEKCLNGGWLLTVVATQSICVLGSRLSGTFSSDTAHLILFVSLAFWLVGAMLYIWLIALIFYRCLFLPLAPGDLSPPYWINMGAMAISTLAGVSLVPQAGRLEILHEILPFVKGMSLLFWATATWWIPMLIALGFWRHVIQRFPIRYDHGFWAAVFPLGMYAVCTQKLIQELDLPFLKIIPAVFVWVSFGAWVVTFVGLIRYLWGHRAGTQPLKN